MSACPAYLLVVRHGPERVAFDLACVREVSRMMYARWLPGAPLGVLGMIELRGEMIPALDLEARVATGASRPSIDHHLVIVEVGTTIAVAVTRVEDVEPLTPERFRTAEGEVPAAVPLLGTARSRSGELLPVLDPQRLLTSGEVVLLRDVVNARLVEVPGGDDDDEDYA